MKETTPIQEQLRKEAKEASNKWFFGGAKVPECTKRTDDFEAGFTAARTSKEEQPALPDDWCVEVDGIVSVPDELDPLIHSIFHHVKCCQARAETENMMICRIAFAAQKFFTGLYAHPKGEQQTAQKDLEEVKRLREALEQIKETVNRASGNPSGYSLTTFHNIAAAALIQ